MIERFGQRMAKRVLVRCGSCSTVTDRSDVLARLLRGRLSWLCKPCASRAEALAKINGGGR